MNEDKKTNIDDELTTDELAQVGECLLDYFESKKEEQKHECD